MAFNEGVKGSLRLPWNSQYSFRCRLTHFGHQNCFWRFLGCLGFVLAAERTGGGSSPLNSRMSPSFATGGGDGGEKILYFLFLLFFALEAEGRGLGLGKAASGPDIETHFPFLLTSMLWSAISIVTQRPCLLTSTFIPDSPRSCFADRA